MDAASEESIIEFQEFEPSMQSSSASSSDDEVTTPRPGSHHRSRLCIYIAVAWFLILIVLIVGLATGAGMAVAWGMAPLSMLFVISVTFLGGPCGCFASSSAQAQRPGDEHAQMPTTSRLRLVWMDNAKTILITLVVIGHTGMAFSGQGAGIGFALRNEGSPNWFTPAAMIGLTLLKPLVVPLFFFISGFFAPSSFDRKGPSGFLKANFWRLGMVYFVFWLVLNPLMYYVTFLLVRPTAGSYSYFPNSAHTWFLNFLLVFQTCYALMGATDMQMAVPKPGKLFGWSVGVTIVQFLASLCCLIGGTTQIAEGPMLGPGGDGFWCPFMFGAGVVAKRNDWLASALPSRLVRCAHVYVLLMITISSVAWFLMASPASVINDEQVFHIFFICLQIPSGPYTVFLQVTVIDFLSRRGNFRNNVTTFLAEGAFAVYVIHYWVVNFYTYTWVEIMESAANIEIVFTRDTKTKTTIGDAGIYGGFVYVAVLSVVTSFVIAGCMKRIPVLKSIL